MEEKFRLLSSLGPALRLFDPETTHNLGIDAAKYGLLPQETRPDPASLHTRVWARDFKNPIGLYLCPMGTLLKHPSLRFMIHVPY